MAAFLKSFSSAASYVTNSSPIDQALVTAIASGDLDKVANIIKQHPYTLNSYIKTDVFTEDGRKVTVERTPLHYAVFAGKIKIVHWLLRQKNIDIDKAESYTNTMPEKTAPKSCLSAGGTALHIAYTCQDPILVHLLATYGADTEKTNALELSPYEMLSTYTTSFMQDSISNSSALSAIANVAICINDYDRCLSDIFREELKQYLAAPNGPLNGLKSALTTDHKLLSTYEESDEIRESLTTLANAISELHSQLIVNPQFFEHYLLFIRTLVPYCLFDDSCDIKNSARHEYLVTLLLDFTKDINNSNKSAEDFIEKSHQKLNISAGQSVLKKREQRNYAIEFLEKIQRAAPDPNEATASSSTAASPAT